MDEKEEVIEVEEVKSFIKDRWKKANEQRYNSIMGYKIDRHIFNAALLVVFGFLFFIAHSANFDLDYFYCPQDSHGSISGLKIMLKDYKVEDVNHGCKNPFYRESWKNQPYLPPGEYGNKPTHLFRSAGVYSFGIIAIALVFNHLVHNRRYFKHDTNKN